MTRGRVRQTISAAFDAVSGSPAALAGGLALTGGHLRILAYHDVTAPDRFDAQMAFVRRHLMPVSVDQVLASLEGAPLPHRATWITFDDGHPSVVDVAAPIMAHWGITATLFVCPSVLDSSRPLWWQAIEVALGRGASLTWRGDTYEGHAGAAALVRILKQVPDGSRREVTAMVEKQWLDGHGAPLSVPQLSLAQLESFGRRGGTVGNHTWDHPCLDRTPPSEQEAQIRTAHEYLCSLGELARPVFAYPNGNWTAASEQALMRHGYRIGVLFDHALTDASSRPLSWSRLRVDASSGLGRFRAVLGGLHPWVTRRRPAAIRRSRE